MAPEADSAEDEIHDELEAHTIALRVVAGLLIAGAASLLATILVPFFLALVVAISLSPLATRIERMGLGRTVSSLACLLLVSAFLAGMAGLVAYQAGAILQHSDRHLERLSQVMADASERLGGDRLLESLGYLQEGDRPEGEPPTRARGGADGGEAAHRAANDPIAFWHDTVRQIIRVLGRWLVTGLGGLLGVIGEGVVFLAFLFYMLHTRSEWLDRLREAMAALGLRPRTREFERIKGEMITYVGCLGLVSSTYVLIIALIAWAIGMPQPLLWGVLTGLLEIVPFFGPLIAGLMTTIVALTTGDALWQPLVMAGAFVVIQTLEGNIIAPLLYGRAVHIDPVTVLVGVLFFGWLWGPLGLALAMPMMIFLRGLLAITPETPALDALVDVDGAAEAAG